MSNEALIDSVEDVLAQGIKLLNAVDSATYGKLAGAPHSASIGQHYRHVLDHFLCLLDGMKTGLIDYDRRDRARELESDLDAARDRTVQLARVFGSMDWRELGSRCTVLYSIGYSHGEAQQIETVLGREIAFCVSHAIHHYAIIRFVCAHFGICVPPEFGVAPSTLKFRAAQQASA